jgi:hypothetical protein
MIFYYTKFQLRRYNRNTCISGSRNFIIFLYFSFIYGES